MIENGRWHLKTQREMRYRSSAWLYVDPCAKLAMLLDGSTTWPSHDLTWQTRFVVESSSRLRVRTIEGFLTIHKDELCPNKMKIGDLRATNKLIFDGPLFYDDDRCLEVAIT